MEWKPLESASFDAGRLIRDSPPRMGHKNKRVVYEIACSSGFPFEGEVNYARWPTQQPPGVLLARPPFSIRQGVFAYERPADSTTASWHVNFADPLLFVAYDSPLLAQDELQVAEHPVLGSLRDALVAAGHEPLTVDDQGSPTPITITGAQRRCVIETRPNPAAGRRHGLYGNAFARAPAELVAAATQALAPPTISNILAMAAPDGGCGAYRRGELDDILSTAFTGFSAARQESERIVTGGPRTTIHTGFWGCGAFGGNRTLMTILQSLAADLAGVETVFWAFDTPGVKLVEAARREYEQLRDATLTVSELLGQLQQRGFEWGVSDGN